MKKGTPISTLFVDIGGVLLTNGWDLRVCQSGTFIKTALR